MFTTQVGKSINNLLHLGQDEIVTLDVLIGYKKLCSVSVLEITYVLTIDETSMQWTHLIGKLFQSVITTLPTLR